MPLAIWPPPPSRSTSSCRTCFRCSTHAAQQACQPFPLLQRAIKVKIWPLSIPNPTTKTRAANSSAPGCPAPPAIPLRSPDRTMAQPISVAADVIRAAWIGPLRAGLSESPACCFAIGVAYPQQNRFVPRFRLHDPLQMRNERRLDHPRSLVFSEMLMACPLPLELSWLD